MGEDPDFDSSIDLENIPECSQDLARELLHQDEKRDVSDIKHDRFLEDAFVLPDDDDSDTEEDNKIACHSKSKEKDLNSVCSKRCKFILRTTLHTRELNQ